MTERLRLDVRGRFEDPPNARCADLREAITEAHLSGDRDRLARLQAEYRAAAHGGNAQGAAARRASPERQAKPARRTPEREVRMSLARFGHLAAGQLEDGSPYWNNVVPGAFDRWLARRSASDCVFSLEHEPSAGAWDHLGVTERGLWGVAYIEEGPIGDEMLEACRSVLWGCSVKLNVVRSEQRSEPGANGWPIWDLLEVDLVDAGPVSSRPADDQCRIMDVGGARPWWYRVEQQHERHVQLAESGILRRAGSGPAWRPRFGA